MLAPTGSSLAAMLGYRGRTSMQRLTEGKGSEQAVDNFCKRLSDNMRIDTSDLREMYAAIQYVKYLDSVVEKEMNKDYELWHWCVVFSFAFDVYEPFSPGFRNNILGEFLELKEEHRKFFYRMLAYFYIKNRKPPFYSSGKTHEERCGSVMKELGRLLEDVCHHNKSGEAMSRIYTETRLDGFEAPTMWSCVCRAADLIEAYANPHFFEDLVAKMRVLPDSSLRTYWSIGERDRVVLAVLVKGKWEGSGFYVAFAVDKPTLAMKGLGRICLRDDDVVDMWIDETFNRAGSYSYDGETLRFRWDDENGVASEMCRPWRRILLEESESLRTLDASLTDHAIRTRMNESLGVMEVPGWEVEEVSIGRSLYSLSLMNGRRFSISRDDAFVSGLTPEDRVLVYKYVDRDEWVVIWPDLSHMMPLSLFDCN